MWINLSLNVTICHGVWGVHHFPRPSCIAMVIKPFMDLVTNDMPLYHCVWYANGGPLGPPLASI